MSQNIFLRATLRQPLRSIFLIALLGLIAFAFTGKTVEYLIVQRETARLGSYYRSIGSLQLTDNSQNWDVTGGADLIKTSAYLAYQDRRRMSSGVMAGLYNSDYDGSNSENSGPNADLFKGITTNNFWFYGRLQTRKEIRPTFGVDPNMAGYALTFDVDEVVSGYPERVQPGQPLTLLFLIEDHEDALPVIEALQEGQRYFIRGWFDLYFTPNPSWENADSNLQIRSLDGDGLWYLPLEGNATVDWSDPALSAAKNELDIAEQNQHALSILTSADMSAMPDTQPSSHLYYLLDGRWLNHEDDLQGRKAIVIQTDFAQRRGLRIGDSITMNLRGLKQPGIHAGYITGDEDRQNWRSYPTQPETFEIVGIFSANVGLDPNLAFIPGSTMPIACESQQGGLDYPRYSFVLRSSQDQDAFIQENQDQLAALGLRLNFVENNGLNFWAGVTPLRRSASAGVEIYGLALLLVLVALIFLYLHQLRRDYAILRALGVPRVEANRQVLFPMMLFGGIGVLAGGLAAWEYALQKAAQSLTSLPTPEGLMPSASLNPAYLAGLVAIILILLSLITWAGTQWVARRPVLELLQGEAGQKAPKNKPVSQTGPAVVAARPELAHSGGPGRAASLPGVSVSSNSTARHAARVNRPAWAALAGYAGRRIRRSGLRSALSLAVAAGLVFVLGWMQWTIEKNRAEVNRLYDTTVVEADILQKNAGVGFAQGYGLVSQDTVEKVLRSGYVQSAYLVAASTRIYTNETSGEAEPAVEAVIGINQAERYFSGTLQGAVVRYAPGWDAGLFSRSWTLEDIGKQAVPAVFPRSTLEQLGLELGDTLTLMDDRKQVNAYIVAGQYSGGAIGYANSPIVLPLSALLAMDGDRLFYQVARFQLDPAKNRQLNSFRAAVAQILAGQDAGALPLRLFIWGEELRTVVAPLEKNLTLLSVLYPTSLAISILIGAGLCLLLLLQTSREAAILRMLGVTRTRVRVLLSGEQTLLSLLGIVLGLGLFVALRQNIGTALAGPALLTAGLYLLGALLGSLVGATLVSNRKPLDLLQVKE